MPQRGTRVFYLVCGSIDVLQRKCARFTLNLGPMSHIGTGEYETLSWLPFSKRVSYFSLVHVFKIRIRFVLG